MLEAAEHTGRMSRMSRPTAPRNAASDGVSGGATGTTAATLTLATGTGYGLDAAATLAVKVLAAAHSGSGDLSRCPSWTTTWWNRCALPANALSGFPGLRRPRLSGNALPALPGDAFAALGSLRALRLDGNALRTLPPGQFAGLSQLEELHLQNNPGAPFTLTAELARTDAAPWAPGPAAIAMRLDTGAPFTLRATLSAPDGTTAGQVSMPAGATQGPPAQVPDGGTPLTLTARPDPVPDTLCEQGPLDIPCFSGFATAAGAPLTLYKAPPRATAPLPEQTLDGDTLRLPLAERFAAQGEAFTYAAQSSDRPWRASASRPACW